MDARFESLMTTLPHPSAELAADLRQVLMDRIPDCREQYHGGRRTGVATYHLGEHGPLCCSLQARCEEVLLSFPAASVPESLGHAKSGVTLRPDELPDMNRIEATIDEAIRRLSGPALRRAG
jgi:hypothetical protein